MNCPIRCPANCAFSDSNRTTALVMSRYISHASTPPLKASTKVTSPTREATYLANRPVHQCRTAVISLHSDPDQVYESRGTRGNRGHRGGRRHLRRAGRSHRLAARSQRTNAGPGVRSAGSMHQHDEIRVVVGL